MWHPPVRACCCELSEDLQPHQMLLLPRKMMRIIDCRRIWNVIYNAQSNRHRPPTSPNTAPATQNDSHDWSSSHMKRHLQCAEQQALPSNLTKYCACHAKWLSWLIFVTYETSFTMRGATGITLQPHQILRLPRKSALQNLSKILRERLKRQFQCAADSTMIRTWSEHDPTMIRAWTRHLAPARSSRLLFALRRRILYWKLQHFALRLSTQISPNTAPATKSDPPTSPNAAPATKNDAHHWLSSHMKRHLQCAEQQASPSNLTKYCACHAKWLSWLIFVTYETSFTMRRATGITLEPHQILRLPRKMTLMIDLRHICNVIYNARSNRHHPPTSPNTAPATQKCTPKSKQNSPWTVEASIPLRGRFDHDPNMIRPWSEHDPTMIRAWTRHLAPARSSRLLFALRRRILYWKLQHFALRLSTQISPNTAPATKSDTPTSPNTAPATKNDTHSDITKCCAWLRLPRKMTLMIDLRHIWNVIYNAGSNRHHPPTSPNTAPATQKCTPKSKQNSPRTVEASIPMRGRFDHDPNMIRPWSEHDPTMIRAWTRHLAPARSSRLLFALRRRILYWKLQHFALRLSTQISPNTAPATKSDTPTSPNTAPATKNDTPTSPNAAPATKGDTPTSPNTAPATKSETVTELLLNWAVTKLLLSCY